MDENRKSRHEEETMRYEILVVQARNGIYNVPDEAIYLFPARDYDSGALMFLVPVGDDTR